MSGAACWAGIRAVLAPRPILPVSSRLRSTLFKRSHWRGRPGAKSPAPWHWCASSTSLMKHRADSASGMVPIIPDEARTFGMESLFRQFGIYASQGQLYKPHDAEMFLYYKESKRRPDSGRGYYRSRFYVFLYGSRYGPGSITRWKWSRSLSTIRCSDSSAWEI